MRKLVNILTLAAVLVALSVSAYAQSQPRFTTLASAVADERTTRLTVTSATGFVASTGSLDYGMFVDSEFMRITGVSGTTITVSRGQSSTNATPHRSGQYVVVGQYGSSAAPGTSGSPFIQTAMVGSCTASAYPVLPLIQVNARTPGLQQGMYNCNNGQWVWQTLLDQPDDRQVATRACTPPGLQALALLTSFGNSNAPFVVGNNMTPVAGTVYYGTIFLPQTQVLTGLSVLNGTVAGTDSLNFYLFRADGVPLANTALAGTVASGADRFQDLNFTATFLATGPARYWVAYQTGGTTTRFRNINLTPGSSTAGLGAFIGVLGSSLTAVYGSIPSNLTTGGTAPNTAATALPTSLIANTVPITCAF